MQAVFLIDKSGSLTNTAVHQSTVAMAGKSTGNNMQLAPSLSSPPALATANAHTPELTGDIDAINHKLDSILSQVRAEAAFDTARGVICHIHAH